MKGKKMFSVTITDMYDDVFNLSFTKHQYPSLRVLIENNYHEEFGECKGRGLCGTCHIKVTAGKLNERIENSEKETLSKQLDVDNNSRLACQIMLDEKIDNMTFKINTN